MNTQKAITDNSNNLLPNDSIEEMTFEECYVDFYLGSLNKTESYRKACNLTGYTFNSKHVTQYAYAYHKRIDATGKVRKALEDKVFTQAIKAHNKLTNLIDSESEQMQYQVAKLQAGDIYSKDTQSTGITVNVNRSNVTISHKNQSLTITPDKDTE